MGSLEYSISTSGSNLLSDGSFQSPALSSPVAIAGVSYAAASLLAPARPFIPLASYVAAAVVLFTQDETISFEPDFGEIGFTVSGPAPSGSVYMVDGYQFSGCTPEQALQDAANFALGLCSWDRVAAGLYARYDPVAGTASVSSLVAEQWGGLYVLYEYKKVDVVLPWSNLVVDPQTATSISGQAGSAQMGGVFAYNATVSGNGNISAYAAFFPGEIQPLDASQVFAPSRRLLAVGGETITTPLASGLLILRQGNQTYAPERGELKFGSIQQAGDTHFIVTAYRFTDCEPDQLNRVGSFANCSWDVVPNGLNLTYSVTSQTMALSNITGAWNSVYMLSSVTVLPPPATPPAPAAPPATAAAGMGGHTLLIVVGVVGGIAVVSGLVLLVSGRSRKKREAGHIDSRPRT